MSSSIYISELDDFNLFPQSPFSLLEKNKKREDKSNRKKQKRIFIKFKKLNNLLFEISLYAENFFKTINQNKDFELFLVNR